MSYYKALNHARALPLQRYCKFDTYHIAVDRGMPVTRVVSRFTLQRILMDTVERIGGCGVVQGGSHVVSYAEGTDFATGSKSVTVQLEDGRSYTVSCGGLIDVHAFALFAGRGFPCVA